MLTFDPVVFAAFSTSALLALGGPVVLALVLRRKTNAPWSALGLGVLTFVVSQLVLRLPWQIGLGVYWKDALAKDATLLMAWIVASAATAALFEETGRWFAFRRFVTKERSYRVGLMFGAGHGGIESVLLVGTSIAANAVLYFLLARGVPVPLPDEARAVVVKQFAALTPGLALMGGLERVFSMCVHIAASLLVLRTVTSGERRWYGWALLLHFTSNLVGVEVTRRFGVYSGELAIGAFALVALWVILREGRRAAAVPGEAAGGTSGAAP